MSFAQSLHQQTVLELQLPIVVGDVTADILLNVCVLVIVDSNALVPASSSEILDHGGLPDAGGALDQDRSNICPDECSEASDVGLHLAGEHEASDTPIVPHRPVGRRQRPCMQPEGLH